MNRYNLLRLFVLSEIADDYEEPTHVWENVSKRAKIAGLAANCDDIGKILVDLVESGFARVYNLWIDPPEQLVGPPLIDQLEHYYFLITEEGKEVLLSSRDRWPFDDEDELLPGWIPPWD